MVFMGNIGVGLVEKGLYGYAPAVEIFYLPVYPERVELPSRNCSMSLLK